MQFNSIEEISQQLPNTTYMFLVCLKYCFADAFIKKGIIRFGQPKEWKELADSDGKRGDPLEGVYASMEDYNEECNDFLLSLRSNSHSFKLDNYTYYYSDDILDMRVYCMYSLNDTSVKIQDFRSQDHQFHKGGIIPNTYFKGLFEQWTKDSYKDSNNMEKPVVVMIHPNKFIELLMNHLRKLGIKDDEIIIKPINYLDYKSKPFIFVSDKTELFQKHSYFKEQSEVRVVIDTTRNEVKQLFDKNNGLIELGPIEDSVVTLLDFYFDDMYFELRGKQMYYTLPQSKNLPLTPDFLISVLMQALSDELPKSPMPINELENEITRISNLLLNKFGVMYNKKNHIVLYENKEYNLGTKAGARMIEHYYIYISENNLIGAKETVNKFRYFYPMYADYFQDFEKRYPHIE